MQVKLLPNVIVVDYVLLCARHIVRLHVLVVAMHIAPKHVKICADNHLALKFVRQHVEIIVQAVVRAHVPAHPLVHAANVQTIVLIHVRADARMLVLQHVGKHAKEDVKVLVTVDVTILAKVDVPLLAKEVVHHLVEVNAVKTVGELALVVVSAMECLVRLKWNIH